MWNIITEVTPVISRANRIIPVHPEIIWTTQMEITKSRHYKKKQPYWHCGHNSESSKTKLQNVFPWKQHNV